MNNDSFVIVVVGRMTSPRVSPEARCEAGNQRGIIPLRPQEIADFLADFLGRLSVSLRISEDTKKRSWLSES